MPRQTEISAIYAIRHKESGRMYVGSAVRLYARWRKHRNQLLNNRHHSRYLQAAWFKYGESAFEFIILEEVADKENLLPRENFWIAKQKSADSQHGFNCCPTAGSQLGMRHSDDARAKMSAAHAGKKKTDKHQKAINSALKGRRLSEQCKEKLSAARTGSTHSQETKDKMSNSRRGKTASPESRAKIAAAMRARHAAYREAGITISGKPLMGYALKQKLHDAT